jgi:iron complex outermembrane receptor protein
LDGSAALAPGLTLRFGATLMEAKYRSYTNALCIFPNPNPPYGNIRPAVQCDASGNYLPRAPKFTSNLGFDWAFNTGAGEVTLTADWNHNSGYFPGQGNRIKQGSYDLFDAQIKIAPSSNFYVRVWGRYLASEKYTNRVNEGTGPVGTSYQPAAPRTYGAAIGLKI